jgi:RNA polymerase sigma factor (sigma-70 family)
MVTNVTTFIKTWSNTQIMSLETGQEQIFLEKALRGEKAGLEYLIKKYKNMAFAVALKIVSNNEDAEEVVQDAFLKAFASLTKFKRASRFSTWLYRITYNTALTKLEQRPTPTVALEDSGNNEVLNLPSDEETNLLQSNERKRFIELALKQLSTDDYIVISLFYIGEKSISEICEILSLKTSTVKMRLMRGRKHLESSLKKLLNSEIEDLL